VLLAVWVALLLVLLQLQRRHPTLRLMRNGGNGCGRWAAGIAFLCRQDWRKALRTARNVKHVKHVLRVLLPV
jgi:hypothetical protein